MPDGDILRLGIPPQYCSVYQQICEDVPASDCARSLAKGIRKRIQFYGSAPRDLLKQIEPLLVSLAAQSEPITLRQVMAVELIIENTKRSSSGRLEGLNLATEACKYVLFALQREAVTESVTQALGEYFVKRVLESSFDDRVAMIQQSPDELSPHLVAQRRGDIDGYLHPYMRHFASQLFVRDSTKSLALPRLAQKRKPIGMDDLVE